jgi:charged multivesicular body protein 6
MKAAMGQFFSFLFGGGEGNTNNNKNQNAISAQDRAILDLKAQRDKLKLYSRKLEAVLDKEKEAALKLLHDGQRNKALLCLRKKKYQEQLLEKTTVQLANLQQMVDTVEFAVVEKKVFDGLKTGNEVLKQIQKEMSIEAVEDLMSDTREAIEYQQEVDSMLSSQLTDLEEEDILEELERLGTEEPEKIKIPASVTEATTRARAEKQEKVAAEANKAKLGVSETIVVEKKVLEDEDLETEWESLSVPEPAKAKPKPQKERKIAEPAM